MAFMRADWARARREAELGMILTDSCGFAGFLAALVVGSSSSASGNTQYATMSEKFLARHAAHNCPVVGWIEPGMHLCWADRRPDGSIGSGPGTISSCTSSRARPRAGSTSSR